MKRKTLFQLFLVDFVIFLTGMGLLPLLPIYARGFGADASDAGIYLAITYTAITAGSLLTGRLAGWIGYRRLFIGAGSLGIPALILLSQASLFWQVIILTAAIWFSGGIGIAMVSIYTGLFAADKSRGKSFGLTYLSLPLASLVSGLTVGKMVEQGGYSFVFVMLALAWAAWPLVAITGLNRWPAANRTSGRERVGGSGQGLGKAFALLLAATLMSSSTIYLLRLATTYAMDTLGFPAGAISGTSAVGGLVTIPVVYTVGTLSDKFGRRRFLIGGYLLGGLAAVVLAGAGQLWAFWLATALAYVSQNAIGSVSPALAADLLPAEARGRGLPVLNAMRNIAGIIGFATGGQLMDAAGTSSLFLIAAVLSVSATLLISQVRAGTATPVAKSDPLDRPSRGRVGLSPTPAKS